MLWKDLLQKPGEQVIAPWIGDKFLRTWNRVWHLGEKSPEEFGWHIFEVTAKTAKWKKSTNLDIGLLKNKQFGYLVGDRFVSDSSAAKLNIKTLHEDFPKVYLIEPGIDRFQRISIGHFYEGSPLVYIGLEMPIGPEENVLQAFLDNEKSTNHISGISPALDAAFLFETWRRDEEERFRREEAERIRLEEEKRIREEKRRELVEKLGSGVTRRDVATTDFATAAKAALAIGNATYLDHRVAPTRGEMIVRFRFMNRRFECVCSQRTLRIIDSGICLTQHNYDDDDFSYGTKGDTWLTLESFPSVIAEAIKLDKLVVYRHA